MNENGELILLRCAMSLILENRSGCVFNVNGLIHFVHNRLPRVSSGPRAMGSAPCLGIASPSGQR